MASIRLADLSQQLNAELHGDGDLVITGVASMHSAKAHDITFLSNSRYREQLSSCHAGAVVLTAKDLEMCPLSALVVDDPYITYAKMAQLMDTTPAPATGIAVSAVIDPSVKLGRDVSVGANAIVESGVELGDEVSIGAGCFIGKWTKIGARTQLWANVTVYHQVEIGESCLIHSGTVIGADGFGYASERGQWLKIPQLGGVRIGNRVEIGACTTIDRGALDDTLIGNGVIIDNQCQIAHNVEIGDNSAVAGGAILAGSLKIGRYCQIGGASVIVGHIEICDKVVLTGMSRVIRAITEPGIYSSGVPAQENKVWRKTAVLLMGIDKINNRLKAVEKKVKGN